MAQIVDSQGRERAAIIAVQDVVVIDPLTGTTRQCFAGEPVPGGLEQAYRVAIAEPKKTTRRKKENE